MDEEQVKKLVADILAEQEAKTQEAIKAAVAEATKSLKAKRPKAPVQAPQELEEPEIETTSPLAKTVADLQAKLEAQDQQRKAQELESFVDEQLEGYNLRLSRKAARSLVMSTLGTPEHTEAGYVLQDGKLLKDAIAQYFGTEDGKALIKPKRTVTGTPVEQGTDITNVPAGSKIPDLSELSF